MPKKKKCTDHEREVIIYCMHKAFYYRRLQMLLWGLTALLLMPIIYFTFIHKVVSLILLLPLIITVVMKEYASRKKKRYGKVWEKNSWKVRGCLSELFEELNCFNDIGAENAQQQGKTKPAFKTPANIWKSTVSQIHYNCLARDFRHAWISTNGEGGTVLLNTDYGMPMEYAGKYIPKHPKMMGSLKTKYYGTFFYDGYVFPAYVKGKSLADAVRIAENSGFRLVSFCGCENLDKEINFTYPWLPMTITLEELKSEFNLTREHINVLKEYIEGCALLGTVSKSESSINVQSLINLCFREINKAIAEFDYNQISIKEETDIEKNKRIVSNRITDKKTKFEEFRKMPNLFSIRRAKLNDSLYGAYKADRSDILRLNAGIYIEMFREWFKAPEIEESVFVISKFIRQKKRKIELDADLKSTKIILALMNVPPDTVEGILTHTMTLNGNNYEFSVEIKLTESFHSITLSKTPSSVVRASLPARSHTGKCR